MFRFCSFPTGGSNQAEVPVIPLFFEEAVINADKF